MVRKQGALVPFQAHSGLHQHTPEPTAGPHHPVHGAGNMVPGTVSSTAGGSRGAPEIDPASADTNSSPRSQHGHCSGQLTKMGLQENPEAFL